MRCDGSQQPLPFFIRFCLGDFPAEIEIIPADDAVLDQPVAGFRDLLLFLFGLRELARIADGDSTGEAVGELDLRVDSGRGQDRTLRVGMAAERSIDGWS